MSTKYLLIWRCYLHEKMNPIVAVEQELPSHDLVQQTAQRPDIRSFRCPYFFPPVVIVSFLFIF